MPKASCFPRAGAGESIEAIRARLGAALAPSETEDVGDVEEAVRELTTRAEAIVFYAQHPPLRRRFQDVSDFLRYWQSHR